MSFRAVEQAGCTERGTTGRCSAHEDAAMEKLPLNIVGLGLIIAGILFAYFLNFVGIIIGLAVDPAA